MSTCLSHRTACAWAGNCYGLIDTNAVIYSAYRSSSLSISVLGKSGPRHIFSVSNTNYWVSEHWTHQLKRSTCSSPPVEDALLVILDAVRWRTQISIKQTRWMECWNLFSVPVPMHERVFCNDGVRGAAPALALPWGHCIIQEGDPHRVLELSEISCILAQDGLCTLLEASHPLVVTIICNVGLLETQKNKRQDWIEGKTYVSC